MPSAGPSVDRCSKVSQVANPTRTAAFITATDGKIAFRHGGKAIVVCHDGSTAFVAPEDFRNYDLKGRIDNSFWKANF